MAKRFTKKRTFRRRRRRRVPRISWAQKLDNHIFKLKFDVADLTTSGAGIISSTFNVRNVSSAQDWSSVSAMFDEYKVVSFKLKYIPLYSQADAGASSLTYAPMFVVYDKDDTTALASTAAALEYDNVRQVDLYRRWSHSVRPGKGAAGTSGYTAWLDTQSPPTLDSIKLYADGLSLSTKYGYYILETVIVCRGRK